MSISEQIENLRRIAKEWNPDTPINPVSVTLNQAADTIESLSAKLQAANMEQSRDEILKEIREKAQELSNQHWGDDERHLIGKGIQCMCVQAENIIKANMERSAENCDKWIPCSEKLPEEDTDVLIRYYNSKEGRFLTDIAWIDEEGDWQLTREKAGYFPPNFKKEITKWMPLPGDKYES